MILVAVSFMSYVFSDKAMIWLLLNCVFLGAYGYSQQKGLIESYVKLIWDKVQEVTLEVVQKIPKAKME